MTEKEWTKEKGKASRLNNEQKEGQRNKLRTNCWMDKKTDSWRTKWTDDSKVHQMDW